MQGKVTLISKVIPATVDNITPAQGETPPKPVIAKDVLRRMGVPDRYQQATFREYDVAFNRHGKVIERLQGFAKKRYWVVICSGNKSGTPGIGKTYLAVAYMGLSWHYDTFIATGREWCPTDAYSVYGGGKDECRKHYDPSTYLFLDMRIEGLNIDMAGIALPEILQNWTKHRCLLLDDLGYEPERTIPRFNALLNHFYNYEKQIIITTALQETEFRKRYMGAISDRFNECGEFVPLTGNSYRQTSRDK